MVSRAATPLILALTSITCLMQNQVFQVSSFSPPPVGKTSSLPYRRSCYDGALAVSFPSPDDFMEPEDHPNRRAEFIDLEPIAESATRQARMENDKENSRRFAKYGDDLWNLRKVMQKLNQKLVQAITNETLEREKEIRAQILAMEAQDPELVYKMELEQMKKAQFDGRLSDSEDHGRNAMAARSQLPQYNLDGLWVGKYGQHGYELINITYAGDTLVATKVTGDNNVPRGEVTFQVNLDPFPPKPVGARGVSTDDEPLQPISLTDKAAKKWGTTQLPRFRGLGQVAEPGFTNTQWMDGQLIIIGEEYFSFAWVPIEQQIFFGRPSPELALKMMRESSAAGSAVGARWDAPPTLEDDVSVLKAYVSSCLERTSETVEEELQGDPFSCIWHGMDTEECYFQ